MCHNENAKSKGTHLVYYDGSCVKKLGKFDEAIDAFDRAVSSNPKYSEAYFFMGVAHNELGDFQAATKSFSAAIDVNPESFDALNAIGVTYEKTKKLEEAFQYFAKAITLKPNAFNTLMSMGIIKLNLKSYAEAETIFQKVLALRPAHLDAANNLGVTKWRQNRFSEAIDIFLKIAEQDPKNKNAYDNLAEIYLEIKDLESFFRFSDKVTGIPRNKDRLLQIACQLAYTQHHTEIGRILKKTDDIFISQDPVGIIYLALLNFALGDLNKVSILLKVYRSIGINYYLELSEANRKFCSAFSGFLTLLVEVQNIKQKDVAPCPEIFHFGESHCLSYAHHMMNLNGEQFKISPRFVAGAKAYHLGYVGLNGQKVLTKINFDNLPSNSYVFISFGEIDCRRDEGLIQASVKKGTRLDDLVDVTVEQFVSFFSDLNEGKNHRLYFFNVPAPCYDSNFSHEENVNVANVRLAFNRSLYSHVKKRNFRTVDVHSLTANEHNFSNDKYHIDGTHLGPSIIPELEALLSDW